MGLVSRERFRLVVLLAIGLVSMAIGCHRSPAGGDFSTPRAAALSWQQAMRRGDAAAMKDAAVNADAARIDLFANLVRAHAALVTAATGRFGSSAAKLFENSPTFVPDNSAQIKAADVVIKADTASLSFAGEEQMKIKRVSGTWKVDCTGDSLFGPSSDAASSAAVWQSVIDVDLQLADGIHSGKYATLEAAVEARRKLIAEAAKP